ncbi:CAP domain-containing protein [Pontimicrobium aquaticum]|uniref:CAP domain-containing protein n=1 Tax=Pontimicrobium aquaticum TaxID=2565367 RepID=A0A4U0EYI2_9FLAO|nr:CAP domain-containing protein [Pontimicrobium aquaticum]TJY37087.1 CAP domain-containing protein [Pontimicrobium aquaticum]
MKKVIIFCYVVVSLMVVSCSKENDLDSFENEANEISLTITQEILELVNLHRKSIGKQELIRNSDADNIAKGHTHYMINQGKISHDNFAKRFLELQDQVQAITAGENVAFGYANGKTVVDAWLNSPGHKANIEGDFVYIGIAAVKDSNGAYYYTQLFYR